MIRIILQCSLKEIKMHRNCEYTGPANALKSIEQHELGQHDPRDKIMRIPLFSSYFWACTHI